MEAALITLLHALSVLASAAAIYIVGLLASLPYRNRTDRLWKTER